MADAPDAPIHAPGSNEAPPVNAIRIGVCPHCEYDLKGLPMEGVCPECGSAYAADSLIAPHTLPSAFSLCLRFGWPLLLVVLMWSPAVLYGRNGESYICCGMASLLMIPVNGAVQGLILQHHPVMSRRHLRAISPRVRRLSRVATALLLLTVVLPLLLFGGCIIIVAALSNIH